jgi:protein ImuB
MERPGGRLRTAMVGTPRCDVRSAQRADPTRKVTPKERQIERARPRCDQELQQILKILHKWGIHTIGQLAALDKEALAARLGSEAMQLWERANGQSYRLLQFVKPPESFEESFEFEHEIETAEPLLFMLRRFLEQLGARLGAIYLVAKEVTLRITFANPPQVRQRRDSSHYRNGFAAANKKSYERVFKIPQPTNDVDLLFRMLQTHLENFKSEQSIVAVALSAQPIRPASRQFGLFETALRNPQQLYETLARLTALLGADRVGTPVLEDTHRPDAFRMEPFSWHGLPAHPIGRMPMPRPALRRFRPAAPAFVLALQHRHLQSEKISGKVVDQRGPYSLSGNWWNEESWARTEWDLELEGGELFRAHETDGAWKLDGIYD